jgi:hypothetical protein
MVLKFLVPVHLYPPDKTLHVEKFNRFQPKQLTINDGFKIALSTFLSRNCAAIGVCYF